MRNVIVEHDMTKNERIEAKKLVEEAKTQEREDISGEWVHPV